VSSAAGPAPTKDRSGLVKLFSRHREVHPYGLADLEEPYWAGSTWWREGDAAVGLLRLPGSSTPVAYAVTATAPEQTRDLLAAVAPQLPPHLIINGVTGLLDPLSRRYDHDWVTPYWKMQLARPERLPAADPAAVEVGADHLDALRDLFAVASSPEAFFTPDLLETGHYVGHWDRGRLIAVAGIHVVSRRHRVAALGNVATHPDERRRGLARRLVGTVCRRLLEEVDTVGLNVGQGNEAGLDLYRRCGFEVVIDYEEAELRLASGGGGRAPDGRLR
jgi:ribosomal protein S18 acetylase RimI-like enzyme